MTACATTSTSAKTALITGQDGSYLAELLLEKGYVVQGFCEAVEIHNLGPHNHVALSYEARDYTAVHDARDPSDVVGPTRSVRSSVWSAQNSKRSAE